jgi:hypothetical protein
MVGHIGDTGYEVTETHENDSLLGHSTVLSR